MVTKPATLRRLMKEITELQTNPSEGIRIQTSEENMLDLIGIIEGPEGTPYAGGYFKISFTFGPEFPAAPPKCRMITKIFHPNVSSAGEICVNTLKKDWKAEYGILHILTTIKCLLIYPNPESALDEEAGKLLLEDYQEYCARAKIVTQVHARVGPAEFAYAGSSSSKAEAAPVASSSGSSSSAPTPTTIPPSISLTAAAPATSHIPRAVSSSYSHGGSAENEPSAGTILQLKPASKEGRHPSPAPLGQGGNVGLGTDSSMANASANVPEPGASASTDLPTKPVKIIKAVKRTAAPPAMTNAEKRKRALKRL